MSTSALTDPELVDLKQPADREAGDGRRWWHVFKRGESERRPLFRRTPRRRLLEELREEHQKMVETLELIQDKLSARTEAGAPSMELDPMPVIEGIRSISRGQEEVSAALGMLNSWVERSTETDQRLNTAVTKVDQTLGQVRDTQGKTHAAIDRVSDRVDAAADRFESMFERMQAAEEAMVADYRKLANRTVLAVAGIGASVVAVLAVFMTAPWA